MEETTQKKESLLDEAKKPFNKLMLVIAVVGLIIGIIGIVLFFIGTKERDISYQITEPTSLIFDSKNTSSNIKLFEKDSVLITNNVYLLTGTLWNSGDLSITKEDVRKQLSFVLDSAKRIIDFKVVKQNDQSVANFKIKQENENSLKLDWDFFDPKYGFTFQVMYIGNENPGFKISGVVLDVSKFNDIPYTPKGKGNFISIIFLLFFSQIMLAVFYIIMRKNVAQRDRFFSNIIILSSIAFLVLSLIYYIVMYNSIPF